MSDASTAWHRFGLGPRRGETPPADPRGWLRAQITAYDPRPAAIAARPGAAPLVREAAAQQAEAREMRRQGSNDTEEAKKARRAYARSRRDSYFEDGRVRLQVAVDSDAPFMERMVHFWANHFAVSADKNQLVDLAGPHEFEAIRPHVAGSFADMVAAASLHPAMLVYLDQTRSIGPGSTVGRRRKGRLGLNENLAREVLELHTLGVGGGYSQADVTELARALTGWTVPRDGRERASASFDDGAIFANNIHEPGRRTILGKSYDQSGPDQALTILTDLADHPSTARHIATKLARHFAGDDPPAALVERVAAAFRTSRGDLPTVYRALIDSPELWVRGPLKFRQPTAWLIASYRMTGAKLPDARLLRRATTEMGQPMWAPGSPAGYGDREADWAAPDALFRRVELTQRLARPIRIEDPVALLKESFPGALNDTTVTAVNGAANDWQAVALMLVAPEMLRR